MRGVGSNSASQSEEEMELRRGPWTMDEDLILVNYISTHGEGRWNALASCAGLKRTGKSCRLRWLNYLRPDVRRGNITPEEQLLILELHSRWGNRWSKIAQHLPGRTDNEIKNYWRTRVQKHAKQLQCDVNSKQFKDAMKYLWIPRLVERIRVANSGLGQTTALPVRQHPAGPLDYAEASSHMAYPNPTPENSANAHASDADPASAPALDFTSYYNLRPSYHSTDDLQLGQIVYPEYQITPPMFCNQDLTLGGDFFAGDGSENAWNVEDMWFWQQQMCDGV